MSQLSISGAISGLDTQGIINSLMSVEGQQQTLIKNRQTTAQKAADAYASVITSFTALASKAQSVANTDAWTGVRASSSSASVTATATGTTTSSLSFDVTRLAARHTLVSSTAGALTDVVSSSGQLTLTRGGESPVTIDVPGSGTLTDVVNAINGADAGIRAAAVRVADGSYRLQVASTATGADAAFTLGGVDNLGSLDVLEAGQDAQVLIGGSSSAAYTATSSSNTFANLVPGLGFTVSKLETGVTVGAAVDGGGVATQISGLVDQANAILSDIATKTKYDTTTKTGGPLLGDSTVRSLQQSILSAVGGSGAPGVQLTKDGRLTFDSAAFQKAFTDNPAKVAKAYGASVDPTPAAGVSSQVTLSNRTSATRAGTYAVQVAVAAAKEQWSMEPPGGVIAGQTVVVMRGSQIVSYTAGAGDSMSDAVAAINGRMADAGLGIAASIDSGSIVLTSASAGASQAFTVTMTDSQTQETTPTVRVTAGQDVQGSIDGRTATGVGMLLTLANQNAGSPPSGASGLSLTVPATASEVSATGGAIGSVTFQPGLAQKLLTVAHDAVAGPSGNNGQLVTARDGRTATVKDLQGQIDSWDLRLETKRLALQRQFTALETALAKLNSQTSALSGLKTSSSSSN